MGLAFRDEVDIGVGIPVWSLAVFRLLLGVKEKTIKDY